MDNGLIATRYVPLTDLNVDEHADVAPVLLRALARARIAAYLADAPDGRRKRLFVAAEERADARTIVASVLRADGREAVLGTAPPAPPESEIDYDVAFSELIADWHVDTHQAIRDAERALTEQDANWRARLERPEASDPIWLDEEHYVPPPPPPLPRLAAPTAGALVLLVASLVLLTLGGMAGLAPDITLLLGVLGVLAGATILVMRLRRRRDEDDDDGAVL
jgi:hypothetical protein